MTTTHTTKTDDNGATIYIETNDCGRCGGTGLFHFTRLGRPVQGVCFRCEGACRLVKTFKTSPAHRAKLAAKRAAKAEAKRLAGQAIRALNRMVTTVAETIQAAYDAAEKDTWADVAEGKRSVSGTVLAASWRENDYGSTLKMLVKLDTNEKVWGTVPRAIENVYHAAIDNGTEEGGDLAGWIRGKAVAFSGTFERSRDDAKFGFFKRPSKATVTA